MLKNEFITFISEYARIMRKSFQHINITSSTTFYFLKEENKKNNNKTKLITGGKTPCGACVRRTEHISRRQLKQ
ncbi:hypothetical protein [Prevotella sp. PTAC]|uniref:hypothetical protein n=1 Tax=Prevotella sp. PTAC TaxID=2736295 RepID=UPI001C132549|nr:hypothetical protein [Prevotella sp. PTAC]NPD53829.1 hypothetical protein [Prevotella sp. PTAC]